MSRTPIASPLHRRTCHFTGRVQGVGFRYTVQNLALQYDVQGFVRNLADGRVELVMEGPDGEMEHLVESLKQKMSCYIRQVAVSEYAATGEFHGFAVRH